MLGKPRTHRARVRSLLVEAMNLVIWLVVGAVIGFVGSLVMGTDAKQGRWTDLAVGIVGAVLAGLFVVPTVGLPTEQRDAFAYGTVLVSAVGAAILVIVVNVIRRTRRRP
jgi:uncharacterized membrane protein YeaQ/YmgE (transglycosylase-associated protein family)